MPATKLVCPHCEKSVEIQVSAVTRSRLCPECGEMVMLQMAEKSTKTKRRALLMDQAEPAAETVAEKPRVADEPQPLPGDVFDRMRMDPEVQQFRRRLVAGVLFVGVVIVALTAWYVVETRKEEEARKKLLGAGQGEQLTGMEKDEKKADLPSMLPREEILPPVTSGNLVFRPPGKGGMRVSSGVDGEKESSPGSSGNLAKLAAGEEALVKFLEAADWKQRAMVVRDRLRVAPLMGAYYAKNADGPIGFDSIVEATDVSPQFSQYVVVFQGGGRRSASVEHTPAGPLVDWESFVGAGAMPWSDFLESKPSSPQLFRVLVSPAGHFENQFGDPSTLKCYSLRNISEPGAKVVYGYVDRRSSLTKEIDYWLEQNEDETVPMVLKLKFPSDAVADFQVWIAEVVRAGWVTE